MSSDKSLDTRENRRLAALARYRVMDTARESGFDELAELASEICGTPIAVVNLIETGRQWFKAEVGLGVDSTPLETSFCGTALLEEDFLLVPDATQDERFACNPLVTGEPGLRFYAGALLKSPEGLPIGTLCVLDYEPRSLSDQQQRAIRILARQVIAQLELRLAVLEREEANIELERRVAERAAELVVAQVERDRLWEASPDLMLVIDFDGVFRRVNPAWTKVLGYAPEELIGHHVNDFVSPDDQAATVDAYELAADGYSPKIENRYRHRDGSVRWISWTAAPAGDMTYATGRDITVEKERQADLEAAQEALRQSQKLEAIGQLTGGVAHDFNNLLTVIRGSVDLLRRPDLTELKRTRYIDAIGDTADRAAKLTGQLLAFARRQALSADLFDAGVSLEEVAAMLKTMTGSRIDLSLQLPAEPFFIVADRSQFDTTIVNLGINARDAMNGEGRLVISTGPVSGIPPIRGHAAITGDFVAVTVSDTGTGIASDQLDRIFEPFFTTKAVGQGTGLGLSQVIGFAKQSGGDIRVDSVVGEGTTFTLYLPRAYPDNAARPEEVTEQERIDGTGVCVLVVEDNQDVGRFATAALAELGYESELAGDAHSALAKLETDAVRFNIVFSDVVMPGMSGIELGQEIRRLYPDMPVILTSGYSHILAQKGRHGFELLHKPYTVEQLSRVLRKAVAWQAAARLPKVPGGSA
ncbi:PAS domain S-box protein [Sphingomonas sp. GB1N7]|uniref:PAS domain S-box protein n=1 Tax=Parasphingomonas caseinilytica TaxID=3096158 RepID=UPI002FCC664C